MSSQNIWGADWTVDKKGNIYKNGNYVPAEHFQYVPTDIIKQAHDIHTGQTSGGSTESSIGGGSSGGYTANPSGGGVTNTAGWTGGSSVGAGIQNAPGTYQAGGASSSSGLGKTVYLNNSDYLNLDSNGNVTGYGGSLNNYGGNQDAMKAALLKAYQAGNFKNTFTYDPNKGGTQWATGQNDWSPFAVDLQTAAKNAGQTVPSAGGVTQASGGQGNAAAGGLTADQLAEMMKNNNQSMTDYWSNQLKDVMQQQQDLYAQLQQQAQQQAEAIANQQRTAYTNAIDSLKGNQRSDLSALNNNLSDAKSSLEDQTFQKWLQARQGLANRGMANPFAMNDASTRLSLGQGQQLSGLYRDTMQKLADTNRGYQNQYNDLYNKMAGIDPSSEASQILADRYKTFGGALNDQAKIFADMIGKTLGYDYAPVSDQLKNNQFYDKLSQQDRQFYDKLTQDYGIKMADIMGVDPATGKPTLDMLKLNESIRSNKASEAAAAQRNNISLINATTSANKLAADIADGNRSADMAYQKLQQTNWADQASQLYNIVKAQGSQISQYKTAVDNYKALPANQQNPQELKALQDAYAKAIDDYNGALTTLSEVSKNAPQFSEPTQISQ